MKEFDKIYIAKYKDIDPITNISYALGTTNEEIEKIVEQLKETGLYEIYKNISDEEWEKLEKKSNDYIFRKYIAKSKKQNRKAFLELIEACKVDSSENINKVKFEIFDEIKWELKGLEYKVFKNEKWKQIPGFKYSISNYGRVRNDKNKKIKQVRYDKYLIRVDIFLDNKKYTVNVCRMEAELFIRKLKENERVIHKDGDARNNYYKNLEIVCM